MMIEAIDQKELKGINKATEQIHVAAQFLSMAGEFLNEKEEDGSHANLGWLMMKEKFITHPFGPDQQFVMELAPAEMAITLLNVKDRLQHELKIKGLTQKEVVAWLKDQLKKHKIEGASKYKIDLPYELPSYADFSDKKFKKTPKNGFIAFSKLRSWGEYFIQKHSLPFSDAEDARTWPHHFDHASLLPIAKQKDGTLSKSIGLGLAIHDTMIDEHYFYVSVWEKDKELDLSKMKKLSSGQWSNEGFKGALLRVSEVAEKTDFKNKIDQFFDESTQQLLKLLNDNLKVKNGK